jgi:CelD/BcsL family acetyltransferase involved in cellulose biosynthesis
MRSPEWLLGWWEVFATPDDELQIILVADAEGALVGIAPLYLQNRWGFTTIRVLGASDNCTHHTSWLSVPGWETLVGKEVAIFLLQCTQNWKRLLFEAVDADAIAIYATMKHLTEHGCLGHQRQINSCWRIFLPDNWDDYLQMLSRSLRKRCRKLQRQFFDSGIIQLRQVEGETDLQEGFKVLLQLHAARWGSVRQSLGVFSDEKFRSFHEAVSKTLLADQKLRLVWVECEGKPMAVEYQFFDGESVYAYQAGLDLSMGEYSPGILSMMAAIQFAITKGCRSFDLLGGDEPYKAHWRAVPIACHDLRFWQRSLRGYLEWTLWSGYMTAARGLKAVLPEHLLSHFLKLFNRFKEACGSRRSSGH